MSISCLLEKIVILIVLLIKNAVTTINAITAIIHTFLTISNIDSNLLTNDSPYLTFVTLSIFLIDSAVFVISLTSFTLITNDDATGFSSKISNISFLSERPAKGEDYDVTMKQSVKRRFMIHIH